nr:unnamed protein product [Naegleria fowleri]
MNNVLNCGNTDNENSKVKQAEANPEIRNLRLEEDCNPDTSNLQLQSHEKTVLDYLEDLQPSNFTTHDPSHEETIPSNYSPQYFLVLKEDAYNYSSDSANSSTTASPMPFSVNTSVFSNSIPLLQEETAPSRIPSAINQSYEDDEVFIPPLKIPTSSRRLEMINETASHSDREEVGDEYSDDYDEEVAQYLDMVEVLTEFTDCDETLSNLNSSSSSISSIRSVSSAASKHPSSPRSLNSISSGGNQTNHGVKNLWSKRPSEPNLAKKKPSSNTSTRPPFLPSSTFTKPEHYVSQYAVIEKPPIKKNKPSTNNNTSKQNTVVKEKKQTKQVDNGSSEESDNNRKQNSKKVVTSVSNQTRSGPTNSLSNSSVTNTLSLPNATHTFLKRKSISFVIPSSSPSIGAPKPPTSKPPIERLASSRKNKTTEQPKQSSNQKPLEMGDAKAATTRSSAQSPIINPPISSFIAEYQGRKKKVEFVAGSNSITTLRAIERKIKEKFEINRKEKILLMYFDKEYKQWLDVDTIKDLKGAKVRVQLVVNKPDTSPSNKSPNISESPAESPLSPFGESFEMSKGWIVMKSLGLGSFGKVILVYDSINNEMIAVKKILYSPETNVKQKIERETSIMKSLKHENIVQFKGVEFSSEWVYIMMEFMSGGSLKQVLKRMGRGLTEGVIQLYLKQILSALKYLHEERDEPIFHRDLKCDNILLKVSRTFIIKEWYITSKKNAELIKLCDFGESKLICKKSHLDKSKQSGSLTLSKTKGALTGTIPFLCIEQLKGEINFKRSHAPDIWSLGMTILEMLLGKNIWFLFYPSNLTTEYQYVEFMINNVHLIHQNIPTSISNDLRDVILRCLELNPEKRPKASELLSHPFFTIDFSESIKNDMCDIYKQIDAIREEYHRLHLAKLPTYRSLTKENEPVSLDSMSLSKSFFE